MVKEKRQLNVRLPVELLDKIENSGISKQELVIDAIELYFDRQGKHDDNNTLAEVLLLKKELEALSGTLGAKESDIRHLESQIGFLQLEYQKISNRLLLEEPKAEPKSWWEFWR